MSTSALDAQRTDEMHEYPGSAYMSVASIVTQHVIAERDGDSAPQALTLAATSNVVVEAVDAVKVTGLNRAVLDVAAVTYDADGVRAEETVLSMSAAPADAAVTIAAGSNMGISLVSTDAAKTAALSGVGLSTDGRYQLIATESNQPLRVLGAGACVDHLVAAKGVYSRDMNLIETHIGASNAGDVLETGYTFRMNADDQLELVRYSRVMDVSGVQTEDVFQRIARFGPPGLNPEGAQSDVPALDAFAQLAAFGLTN